MHFLQNEDRLPHGVPAHGCAIKAYLGAYYLETEKNLFVRKIYLLPQTGSTLIGQTENGALKNTRWKFHAALLMDSGDGDSEKSYVLDYDNFSHPILLAEYLSLYGLTTQDEIDFARCSDRIRSSFAVVDRHQYLQDFAYNWGTKTVVCRRVDAPWWSSSQLEFFKRKALALRPPLYN